MTARRPPLSAATVGVGAVAIAALAFVAGALVVPQPTPDLATAPAGDAVIAVSAETFVDERVVTVTPQLTEALSLEVTDTGRVTQTSCSAGAALSSGSSPATLDDRPVLALHTSVPPWRDLAAGARGADVLSLETELARLGYDLSPDDYFGQGTRAAVADLQTQIGVARASGVLSVASVLWLPSPQVTVSSCEVSLGSRLTSGVIATVSGGLASLRVTSDLSAAAAGERLLQYGDLTAAIDGEGLVTDPAFLAAVAAGPELALLIDEKSGATLSLDSVLAAPLDVVVLPPSALFEVSAGTGCVIADGEARAVRVVSSALGKTMVTFDEGGVPDEVSVDPAASSGGCA